MDNLVFHNLLRWKIIIPPILTTSRIHFFSKGWENVLFELGSIRVKLSFAFRNICCSNVNGNSYTYRDLTSRFSLYPGFFSLFLVVFLLLWQVTWYSGFFSLFSRSFSPSLLPSWGFANHESSQGPGYDKWPLRLRDPGPQHGRVLQERRVDWNRRWKQYPVPARLGRHCGLECSQAFSVRGIQSAVQECHAQCSSRYCPAADQ